jgi:mannose-1-phosphate guanylyltransferase/mannose-6-phosphate isomerase
MIHPILLCGGPGARLWPASTQQKPKPFFNLLGGPSLFQRTVSRVADLKNAGPPLIVAGQAHIGLIIDQLAEAKAQSTILAEPASRDSAAAIIAGALFVARSNARGLVMAIACDHHIPDGEAFADAVAAATNAAKAGRIVTFGIRPSRPSSAYGYIRPGTPIATGGAVHEVESFLEKPDASRARALIADGCLWNSGNFLFRADVMLDEARRLCPGLVEAVQASLNEARTSNSAQVLGSSFVDCPRISIDIGVMEKTDRAAVLPVSYEWSDLGSWDAIWAASEKDRSGNAIVGSVLADSSENCLLRAEPGVELVAAGLRDVAVVAAEGRVLVCALHHAPGIKRAVSALAALSRGETDQ